MIFGMQIFWGLCIKPPDAQHSYTPSKGFFAPVRPVSSHRLQGMLCPKSQKTIQAPWHPVNLSPNLRTNDRTQSTKTAKIISVMVMTTTH